jgi:hypothetical protein
LNPNKDSVADLAKRFPQPLVWQAHVENVQINDQRQPFINAAVAVAAVSHGVDILASQEDLTNYGSDPFLLGMRKAIFLPNSEAIYYNIAFCPIVVPEQFYAKQRPTISSVPARGSTSMNNNNNNNIQSSSPVLRLSPAAYAPSNANSLRVNNNNNNIASFGNNEVSMMPLMMQMIQELLETVKEQKNNNNNNNNNNSPNNNNNNNSVIPNKSKICDLVSANLYLKPDSWDFWPQIVFQTCDRDYLRFDQIFEQLVKHVDTTSHHQSLQADIYLIQTKQGLGFFVERDPGLFPQADIDHHLRTLKFNYTMWVSNIRNIQLEKTGKRVDFKKIMNCFNETTSSEIENIIESAVVTSSKPAAAGNTKGRYNNNNNNNNRARASSQNNNNKNGECRKCKESGKTTQFKSCSLHNKYARAHSPGNDSATARP